MTHPRWRRIRVGVNAAMLVLALAGWARSHYHGDSVIVTTTSARTTVGLVPGRLAIVFARPTAQGSDGPLLRYRGPPWKASTEPMGVGVVPRVARPAEVPPNDTPLRLPTTRTGSMPVTMTTAAIPLWTVALTSAAMLAFDLRRRRRDLP